MALKLILMVMIPATVANPGGEMALANVTRFASGDLFSLVGPDCGLTRCMEVSHGTALAAMGAVGGAGCACQCRKETPAFREDQRICINRIDECQMASYGRGATKPQIPFVFLPLKGQIVYPSKEIIFTDVEDAVCAVTSAQYLSPSGWVTVRDLVDNDVPFGLYRDEGSTYLQWRGSSTLHDRLEGRLVTVHVLCSAATPTRLAASCAAFRVAGATQNTVLDVRSIPFHAGEMVNTEQNSPSKGLSVLESLAIGVCVLMLVFVYAAGITFYVHYKQKQRRKSSDPELNLSNTASTENMSTIDSRIDMENMIMKTNPLLKLDNMRNDFLNDAGLSDVSECTEDTIDSSKKLQRFQSMNSNIVSAMVHNHRKKPPRPSQRIPTPERLTERLQRRSASPELEKAPHSDLSIIDCSVENNSMTSLNPPTNIEPVIRRKLYFNPVFFEVEHLKNPPPAAIDFLIKIREIMAIAKEKMISKRFIPMLSDIPEEELYHTVDLGWDIPCARRGRRFSAISLKRENSRRAIHCGGCPGCDSNDKSQKAPGLIRSNSCKTCVSDDYKQKIVQKWLDEVPSPPQTIRPVKSVAKVSGTPRIVESKKKNDVELSSIIPATHTQSDEPQSNKQEASKLTEPFVTGSRIKEIVTDRQNLEKLKHQINTHQGSGRNELKVSPSLSKKTQEKKSPSSNATRRVLRKKLPPPPPPPVNEQSPLKIEDKEPIYPEVKKKMEAVIKELNKCNRTEECELEELRRHAASPNVPKLVIPVVAADSNYYCEDNITSNINDNSQHNEMYMEFDSLERNILNRRRFSLDFGAGVIERGQAIHTNIEKPQERLSKSWRDINMAVNSSKTAQVNLHDINSCQVNSLFINPGEPVYNNIEKPGSLTIEVRGSPVDTGQIIHEDFDPDTLDRKPKRESKKSVEKILLKSGGSFKHKALAHHENEFESGERKTPPEAVFTRKIGSLRQIYEAKTKGQNEARPFYGRRGSLPYANHEVPFRKSIHPSEFLRKTDNHDVPKPPLPSKQRRGSEKYSPPSERLRQEENEHIGQYLRSDNLNIRKSGRRSSRARSRRVDLKKLCRTEDSGYLSTDSNESKCRARYLLQLRPKFATPETALKPNLTPVARTLAVQMESDTDEIESLCDGRSESGGESVETDSVFFGNFDESKELYAELGLCGFETQNILAPSQEQIDSGFACETNITLSGDSDSEHRSVISIITGHDGRSSVASTNNLDDPPYIQSVEC
ncbi:uncharacterized protein [Battus philenor]|uniref:uncharacterized protein n=1 Tax=Battus philenor TaxID=42288 RepID=UPI0035D0DDEC